MEPRKTPPEHYSLDIFADASSVRDVLKGLPHHSVYDSIHICKY